MKLVHLLQSPVKGKKLRGVFSDGSKIDFGSDVSQTYVEGATVQKRNAYWKRHLANAVENERIRRLVPSASLLSAYVLWLTPSIRDNVRALNNALTHSKHHSSVDALLHEF